MGNKINNTWKVFPWEGKELIDKLIILFPYNTHTLPAKFSITSTHNSPAMRWIAIIRHHYHNTPMAEFEFLTGKGAKI